MPDKDWRISVRNTRGGIDGVYTFCLRETAPQGNENLNAVTVVTDVAAWLTAPCRGCLTVAWSLADFKVRELGTVTPQAAEHVVNLVGSLPAGTGIAPLPCSLCVTVKTDTATKRGRGRFHIPGPEGADHFVSSLNWNTASSYFVACQTLADTLLAGHDATHDLISHHYSLRVWSTKDLLSRDAVTAVARQNIRWIRTRQTAP